MCNKLKYPTKKVARKAKGAHARFAGYIRVYQCPECKAFHLTSQRNRDAFNKTSYGCKKRASTERHCRKDYSLEVMA